MTGRSYALVVQRDCLHQQHSMHGSWSVFATQRDAAMGSILKLRLPSLDANTTQQVVPVQGEPN
jgi:hypothetical protein